MAEIDAIDFDPASVQTNMLFLRLDPGTAEELRSHLRQHGILIGGGHNVRLVTHLDVTREDVERVVRIVKSFFAGSVSLRLGA